MSEYKEQSDHTNFVDEAKVIYWKRAISGSEQLVLSTKAQQQREKREKEIGHFSD